MFLPLLLAAAAPDEVPAWEVRDWVVLVFIGVLVTVLWLYFRRMFDEKTKDQDRAPPGS